ncbi:hypothetical protein [Actinoplanes derwentensis]|uniref:Uncharacterized protein n=1 Tax=Actinoplanes derwentensis TaxID=113562 RepID=A0A1H1YCV6_9ACTN|nr:hypothetical protein [Actinoplanes derwentensis]GID81089.1 hypothetical protein Ade03nite_00130 [Actinoplanes derwentensis]SDT19119.1 hypothetical protein SAMN04489716_2798 [Actinoplanes derwentensis]
MTVVRAHHHHNPYDHLFGGDEFDELLRDLGQRRAASIEHHHRAGTYPRAAMGFVILDPTAGPWVPNTSAVLGAITIGPDSERFLPNAAAKAGGHRRLGRNYGEAVLVDPHLCGRAAFRYGHSAQVRGVIVGASSQAPDQDLYEAGQLAADFVTAIAARQAGWESKTGETDWLSADDRPDREYRDMVSFFDAGAPADRP